MALYSKYERWKPVYGIIELLEDYLEEELTKQRFWIFIYNKKKKKLY